MLDLIFSIVLYEDRDEGLLRDNGIPKYLKEDHVSCVRNFIIVNIYNKIW